MTSRREFIKVGLAASALPLAVQADLDSREPVPTVELYKVLYDTRFPPSIAFARRAESRGLAIHAIAGDMTRFWYDDLYYRWQQGPAAIAGLTAHGALFCLERLGWDHRLRVVFRGEHALASGGNVAHRFEGPAALLATATATCATAGTAWSHALADVVAECSRGRTPRQSLGTRTASAATLQPTEALFSWVIAPVVRA
jgi:hypothetical protein